MDFPTLVLPTMATGIPFLITFPWQTIQPICQFGSLCFPPVVTVPPGWQIPHLPHQNQVPVLSAKRNEEVRSRRCFSCRESSTHLLNGDPSRLFAAGAMRSAIASPATVIFPFRNALRVNSPGLAREAPFLTRSSKICCCISIDPWHEISTKSSPV